MPQRFLRPGLRTSPRWNSVSHRAARIFIAILNVCDDYGRYDGRASVIWADTFSVWNEQNPDDQVTRDQTAADCEQLAAVGLLTFYEVDGRKYVQVSQWQEKARNKSKWPPLPSIRPPMAAKTCQNLPPSPSSSPSVLAIANGDGGIDLSKPPEVPQWVYQLVENIRGEGGDYTDAEARTAYFALEGNDWKYGRGDKRTALMRQMDWDRGRHPPRKSDSKVHPDPKEGYRCGMGKKLTYTLSREPRLEDFNGNAEHLEWAMDGYTQWKQLNTNGK